jgi:hypothetical protein
LIQSRQVGIGEIGWLKTQQRCSYREQPPQLWRGMWHCQRTGKATECEEDTMREYLQRAVALAILIVRARERAV